MGAGAGAVKSEDSASFIAVSVAEPPAFLSKVDRPAFAFVSSVASPAEPPAAAAVEAGAGAGAGAEAAGAEAEAAAAALLH
jgi:hypothetical protein